MTPSVLSEVLRDLDEENFCVLDRFVGEPTLARLQREVKERLRTVATSDAIGRVAGATSGSGAAVSAFRSDISMWARIGGERGHVGALDTLANRVDELIHRLRDGSYLEEDVDDGSLATTSASARASMRAARAQLRGVRARMADAMLAVYPPGGARYIRHVDNVCANGLGKRCNGRRLVRAPEYRANTGRDRSCTMLLLNQPCAECTCRALSLPVHARAHHRRQSTM